MKGLAELVLSLCDLIEAEGRLLRKSVKRTGQGCVLSAVGIIFIGAALAFLVAAAYEAVAALVPAPVAFLILAAMCGLFAAGILWSARQCTRKSPKKPQN